MKNFISKGDVLTLTAPYARSSGEGALVGTLFCVATADVANATAGEFMASGVFDLVALGAASGQDIAAGGAVYWDDTNKRCTKTATDNTLIGKAVAAKASTATTVRVKIG